MIFSYSCEQYEGLRAQSLFGFRTQGPTPPEAPKPRISREARVPKSSHWVLLRDFVRYQVRKADHLPPAYLM